MEETNGSNGSKNTETNEDVFLAPLNPIIPIERTPSRKNSRVTDEDSDSQSDSSRQSTRKKPKKNKKATIKELEEKIILLEAKYNKIIKQYEDRVVFLEQENDKKDKILQSLAGENDETKTRFKDVFQRIDNLEANNVEMGTTTETTDKKSYADKLKGESTAKIIQMVKQEQNESIKKENRVIVFGLSISNSKEKEEFDKHNEDLIAKLCEDLKIKKETIKSLFRLKQKNETDTQSTPFIIEFRNNEEKMNILKQAKLLRNIEGYNGVYINNDLTKNERELLKQLIMERNRRNEEENTKNTECTYYYGIRNFEIKQIKKKVSA